MDGDPVAKWEEFIRSRYWDELLELADSYPVRRSLVIRFPDLDRYDPEFADELLEHPDEMLEAARTALLDIDLPMDVFLEIAHVRIVGLPRRFKTSDLRSDQIGKLVALEGLVRTTTEVRPKITSAAFECQRCGHVFYKPQTSSKFQEPYDCPNDACDRRGPFKLLLSQSKFVDAQNVRLQESPEDLRGGEPPQALDVQLEDDLTGNIYPGDRLAINGILRSYQRTTQTGKSTFFDLYLDGNSLEMMEQEFEEIDISPEDERLLQEMADDPDIYDKVTRSIAPSIYGYDDVKEALALQLFSGVSKSLPDGTRLRGDIHVLLVGDPGIAKSQLLRYISKLSPRGIYTSGKSSTSAGLTATAVKDELGDGRWTLEAGALVLADKGVACIEENQLVATSRGLVPIKDVSVSDWVVNYDGSRSWGKVERVIDNGLRKTIKIHAYTGDVIEVTPDHKILTGRGWVSAEDLTVEDHLLIPADYSPYVMEDETSFERGIIMGFALSEMKIDEIKTKNRVEFCTSLDDSDCTDHIRSLVKKHYGTELNSTDLPPVTKSTGDKEANVGKSKWFRCNSAELKQDIDDLFSGKFSLQDKDSCAGFISGILCTNCSISSKQAKNEDKGEGKDEVKNLIQIDLSRSKYPDEHPDEQLARMVKLVNAVFHSFGILSVIRNDMDSIQISSLRSYNRVIELFGRYVVGKNREKLHPIDPKRKVTSHDIGPDQDTDHNIPQDTDHNILQDTNHDDLLDEEYQRWFEKVEFDIPSTTDLGLHSEIRLACNNHRTTLSLMETLREHWNTITKVPFRKPEKSYVLNPIEKIEAGSLRCVFDLTITGTHNFLISATIVSNCVDEMDKMRRDDRSALHEALEQQTISVAKAGIMASLKSRCALLAAANPKYGRFDKYEGIAQQINLSPALMSRFDLIFVLTDEPSDSRDSRIAHHIGQSIYAGELSLQEGISLDEVDAAMEVIKPAIEPDILRKYIAYARKNVFPVLAPEARDRLESYYVNLRKQGEDSNKPVPVTARQLEALFRLGEASARLRFSNKITLDDAERVIKIVESCLRQVGVDPETGLFDADVIATGISKSTRDKTKVMLDLVRDLSSKHQGMAPLEIVLDQAEEQGIDKHKAEEIIRRLRQNGSIFEPKTGFLKLP